MTVPTSAEQHARQIGVLLRRGVGGDDPRLLEAFGRWTDATRGGLDGEHLDEQARVLRRLRNDMLAGCDPVQQRAALDRVTEQAGHGICAIADDLKHAVGARLSERVETALSAALEGLVNAERAALDAHDEGRLDDAEQWLADNYGPVLWDRSDPRGLTVRATGGTAAPALVTGMSALLGDLVESGRYDRGVRYAQAGNVIGLELRRGRIRAWVLGSSDVPYVCLVDPAPLDGAGHAHPFLGCSCPDIDPCKHAVAALVVFADQAADEGKLLRWWIGEH